MSRKYAGIGSRKAPIEIRLMMSAVALNLYNEGWTLRSGGAPGADMAFESGATPLEDYSRCEIYLPWDGFEGRKMVALDRPTREAYAIAALAHPVWDRLPQSYRALHARNSHVVLGPMLDDPVSMVICWTPGGSRRGGTGQAMRLAEMYDIPVFDLAVPAAERRVMTWLEAA